MARPYRARGDAGAVALEASFVAPALIFLIFLGVQSGLYFYGQAVAIQAAREGVSQLRLAPDEGSYDAVRATVVERTESFASTVGNSGLVEATAVPEYDPAAGRVAMTVSGSVITLVPGLDLTVTQRAEGEIERFEADPGP